MERGWSVKAIDRLIVTSNAYRQSSAPDEAKSKVDPQNRLFWRMNRKRLEGEMIRDAALTVAGTLNPQIGGRPVRIPIEPEVYDLIFTESERDGLWPVNPDQHVQNRRGHLPVSTSGACGCRCSRHSISRMRSRRARCGRFRRTRCRRSRCSTPASCRRCRRLSRRGSRNPARKDRGCQIDTAWRLALARPPRPAETRLAQRVLQDRRLAAGFLSGAVQSKRVCLCSITATYRARGDAARRAGASGARVRIAGPGVAAAARGSATGESAGGEGAALRRRRRSRSSSCSWSAVRARSTRSIPKPALEKFNGQPLPDSYGKVVSQFTKGDTPLLKSPWTFKKYGQCGRDVSTLFPAHRRNASTTCASSAASTPTARCMRRRCTR